MFLFEKRALLLRNRKSKSKATKFLKFVTGNKMAIYHLNLKNGSRDGGQSGAAKCDYITREGKYKKKDLDEVVFSTSINLPTWAENGRDFWQAADQYERANARLFREIEFALPREMNDEQRATLVADFAEQVIGNQLPCTLAVHRGGPDGGNPHCHMVFSERMLDGLDRSRETFFKRANSKEPSKGGAKKTTAHNGREWLLELRHQWAITANKHLSALGHNQKIDHRTLDAQGINRAPGVHLGARSLAAAERGIRTKRAVTYQIKVLENESKQVKLQELNDKSTALYFMIERAGAPIIEHKEERTNTRRSERDSGFSL